MIAADTLNIRQPFTFNKTRKKIIMKKILTILGQEVTIMFNMAVQISFEEITGKPFSEIDTNVSKDSLALAYSAIIANNPDCNITVDNLMHDASGAELNAVIKAISDSFVEWNKVPGTLADEETRRRRRKRRKRK